MYGILNEDYKPEDIKSKTDNVVNTGLDFNSVRKKLLEKKHLVNLRRLIMKKVLQLKLKKMKKKNNKK